MASVGVASEPFGTALRRLRERAGLTQEQLAERAGLSANAISALERGERRHPYPHTVRVLVEALKLSVEEHMCLELAVPRRRNQASAPPVAAPLAVPSAFLVPRQLPAVTRSFTGRGSDLARLDALLRVTGHPDPDGGQGGGPTVAVISGSAGVGKTTLAVVWAQRVRKRFPDGHLYVNLRGYDPGPPAKPGEALDGFLRALNVPVDKIPPTLEQRAALFRSLLDDRRVLVVLDNANSAEQVRTLLPGSPSCLVVVTSRADLTGLVVSAGAVRVSLETLPAPDAIALLRGIIGAGRCAAEPEAVAELAALCGRLPLALQLAGQRAAARPGIRLVDLVAELANEAQRLDVLGAGADEYTAVRSMFSWSYGSVPEPQAHMFRLVGLHPGPDISVHAAAALTGNTPAEAWRLLDDLAEAHLVEHAGRARFRLHDLLRVYAREQAHGHLTPETCDAAIRRLVDFYLHTATAADRLLHPGRRFGRDDEVSAPDHAIVFAGYDHALEWCETERANLVAATRTAAETGLHAAAWRLPDSLWSFFYVRKHWTDWTVVCGIGLEAARRLGDRTGECRMLNGLATVSRDLHRFDEAIEHYQQILRLARAAGDRWSEGTSLSNLGDTYLGLHRYHEALQHSRRGLRILDELGNRYLQGVALGNVGEAYLGLRRYDEALSSFLEVLRLCRQIDHRYGEGLTLIHLGEAYLGLRRYDDAIAHLSQALDLCRDIGDQHGEALVFHNLGLVHSAAGRSAAAHQHWREALTIFEGLGDPRAHDIRARLLEQGRTV
jgi:tetratricopeptide (TPR) repeat protein/transcriptional regulator with XRE-family HTH domain